MPFIINALATLEIKTFMKRVDDNGLSASSTASKPAHSQDVWDCAVKGPGNTASRGERQGAFLGLCLPTQFGPAYAVWSSFPRGLREFQSMSCVFVPLTSQIPIGKPSALFRMDYGEILSGSG